MPFDRSLTLLDSLLPDGERRTGRHWDDPDDPAELAGLRRDLMDLLSARAAPGGAAGRGLEGTILFYGLPDLSTLDLQSARGLAELRTAVARALAAFEPRLSEPVVAVDGLDRASGGVPGCRLRIDAVMTVDGRRRRVTVRAELDGNRRWTTLDCEVTG